MDKKRSLSPFFQVFVYILLVLLPRMLAFSIHCFTRMASFTREFLPDESSSTMITGCLVIVASITRQRPASLI